MVDAQVDKTKMVAAEGNKTHMVKPRVVRVAQLASLDDKLPSTPVTEGLERIRTIRAISDGEQIYAEDSILDVAPDMAKEYCDRTFVGQAAHFGEVLAHNAKGHEIVRAIRVK